MAGHVVYDLKSVGALEMKFVAPIPEQIGTTTTQNKVYGQFYILVVFCRYLWATNPVYKGPQILSIWKYFVSLARVA